MRNYFNIYQNTSLFRGMNNEEIQIAIQRLNGTKRTYKKNELLFPHEATLKYTCILLSGSLDINQITFENDLILLKRIQPGEVFAYALSVSGSGHDSIEITATSTSEILLLDTRNLLNKSPEHLSLLEIQLIQNLTMTMVQKNMMLNTKIQIISQKTLRQKIQLYLNQLTKEQGSNQVSLPFTREKLSHFLVSNRSAISRELASMQTDGIITIDGNIITLNH